LCDEGEGLLCADIVEKVPNRGSPKSPPIRGLQRDQRSDVLELSWVFLHADNGCVGSEAAAVQNRSHVFGVGSGFRVAHEPTTSRYSRTP
jgi:hypothetical protein